MNITAERIGRRTYLRGNTFPFRDIIRDVGCHWDSVEGAWWIGDNAKADALVAKVAAILPPARYIKVGDDWHIKGQGLVVGKNVVVKKANGEEKTELVEAIISTGADGMQIASVAKTRATSRSPRGSSRSYDHSGARRTGCSCGSREGYSRTSDCTQCRYDNE